MTEVRETVLAWAVCPLCRGRETGYDYHMESNPASVVCPPGFCKYQLCEEFADEHCLPTDYVWQEFIDPNVSSLEEVFTVLSLY